MGPKDGFIRNSSRKSNELKKKREHPFCRLDYHDFPKIFHQPKKNNPNHKRKTTIEGGKNAKMEFLKRAPRSGFSYVNVRLK
jgi:hypothetical protein